MDTRALEHLSTFSSSLPGSRSGRSYIVLATYRSSLRSELPFSDLRRRLRIVKYLKKSSNLDNFLLKLPFFKILYISDLVLIDNEFFDE
jgi:hypothetical protein